MERSTVCPPEKPMCLQNFFAGWQQDFLLGEGREEFSPPSHLDGCVLQSRNLRGVRNDGVMLRALINEFLKVLLQLFKVLLSHCQGCLPIAKCTEWRTCPHLGNGAHGPH